MIDTLIPEEVQLRNNFDNLDELLLLSENESPSSIESTLAISDRIDSRNRRTQFWQPRFEELPHERVQLKTSAEEVLIVQLTQLPEGLKHAFSGDGETFPVIISSNLQNSQEL